MVWLLVALGSLLGGIATVTLIGAALLLGLPLRWLRNLLSVAVGTLLGIAFLGLLPEALANLGPGIAPTLMLAALLGFFVLEKLLIYHHCHQGECDPRVHAPVLIVVGDAVHNTVDGVAIGAAFVVSPPLGFATALAVALHEVPQELGDYAVLIEGGLEPGRAFLWNLASALPTLPAALLAYWALSTAEAAVPYLLVLGAGAFTYVALADLVPLLHRTGSRPQNIIQTGLVFLGVAVIWLLEAVL